MAGVLTDLHAADVRYHVDCKASFMFPRSVQAASRQSSVNSTSDQPLDTAFESIMAYLSGNKTIVHNSVDLYNKYVQEEGNILTRRQLVSNILEKFENEIVLPRNLYTISF